ncbi:MAG: family 78 glycoside hydrolase catalytic domain [Bacteroidota bacterium]
MRYLFSFLLCVPFLLSGQNLPIAEQWTEGFWDAKWITHPTASAKEYGVYHFRKSFVLTELPEQFIVHVSGDNRYRLLINGREVSLGPARGDILHWRFETVDLRPYLKQGENILAAVVWNAGINMPVAQISQQTAFILQGNSEAESLVNTNKSWKVFQNPAYQPELASLRNLNTYLVVGPGDVVNGALYPWGWEGDNFDDQSWTPSRELAVGKGFGLGTDGNWRLVPRQIPLLEQRLQRFDSIRRSDGVQPSLGFLRGKVSLAIPAGKKVSFLLDQGYLTVGYPELIVSGGKGASITFSYAEALMNEERQKGNRNEIEGKKLMGYADVFLPDGGKERLFRPLWWRTWRYIQVDIMTGEEDLVLNDLSSWFVAYPFVQKASFQSDQAWLEDIWQVGWRTARLCAGETYFDCPYYEQLQYVGDTRIQALISLYVTGDDRLMRRAINDYDESRLWNGLTQSRYPCHKLQVIPTYSLFWISMVHDYWMHRDEAEYVVDKLTGVRSILGWYETQLNENGLFGMSKWWNFVDWAKEWPWSPTRRIGGVPAEDADGNSAVLSLQYAYTLRQAAELHRAFGDTYHAERYEMQREKLLEAIRKHCWNPEKAMFRDLPDTDIYSQHANILAILADALPESEQAALLAKVMNDSSLIQATFYFKFYLFQAMHKLDVADHYLPQLKPWQDMLDLGLTTFAEKPDPTRSDCHAWSASPNYDLLATVAGIRPAEPGFRSVHIAPSLGELQSVSAKMPHPKGDISLDLQRDGQKLKAQIVLPEGLTGEFEWKGQKMALSGGQNQFVMKNR